VVVVVTSGVACYGVVAGRVKVDAVVVVAGNVACYDVVV